MKLELRAVTKHFGSLAANKDVNLVVEPGQIHCLLGENGAGKSTLMNVLYGMITPDSGQLLINDEVVTIRDPKDAVAFGSRGNAYLAKRDLDRAIAARGRFPAIDVSASLSRVMDRIVAPAHREAARRFRRWLAAFDAKRDLVMMGAYTKGSDKELDEAIARMPALERFLHQEGNEASAFDASLSGLMSAVG